MTYTLSLQKFHVSLVSDDLFSQKTVSKLFLSFQQRIEPVRFFRISIRHIDKEHQLIISQMVIDRSDKRNRLNERKKIFRVHLLLD